MRKTIDFDEVDIAKIEEYGKSKDIKSFAEMVRSIIRESGASSISEDKISDDNFALIADALVQINGKVDEMLMHFAPKHAGEVK